jgi:hypothetical protein
VPGRLPLAVSDHTLELDSTLVLGMSGSGKTTFAVIYNLNAPAACHFFFDDLGRFATRLRYLKLEDGSYLRPCYTANELEAAVSSRWVVFNPHRMFPGNPKAAFKFFCKWVYDVCKRGAGKKFVTVDEIWQYCTADSIPLELALISQTGREEHIELVTCTQRPELVNASITGQCTELVCFRLDEPDALRAARGLGMDREAVKNLPLGHYLARNRLTGKQFRGALW